MLTNPRIAVAKIRTQVCVLSALAAAVSTIGFIDFAAEPAAWAQAAACYPARITAFDGEPLKGHAGVARLMIEACQRPARVLVGGARGDNEPIRVQFGPSGSGFVSGVAINPCDHQFSFVTDLPGKPLKVWAQLEDRRYDGFAEFTLADDSEPPKITVTPPSGTIVRPGQRMTIAVTASERYEDGHQGWQTGVKSIRVEDLTRHEGLPPWQNENPQPQPCNSKTWTKTHEMQFTVPDPAPSSVVRLRVFVKDYQNPEVQQDIEYPTKGDWYGAFGWTHICQGGGNRDETRGISDLTLDHDGRGNLTGTLAGSVPERTMIMPSCSSYRLLAPGTFRAKLLGSYTPEPDRFSVQAVDVQTTHGRASLTCPSGGSTFEQAFFSVYEGPMFKDAFRDLRRQPDGGLKTSDERTFSASGGTCTTTYSLTLHRTQN
jgi:hypothetical protein